MVSVEDFILEGDGLVPNSIFPLIIYRNAFSSNLTEIEAILRTNDWLPDWYSAKGMYPRHHFHSDAHEFIAVMNGELTCQLGGENGISAHMYRGDAISIPAGVAHCGKSISEDLQILGAFPLGFGVRDFRLGYPSEYSRIVERVQRVPIPAYDPLFGSSGPLVKLWNRYS